MEKENIIWKTEKVWESLKVWDNITLYFNDDTEIENKKWKVHLEKRWKRKLISWKISDIKAGYFVINGFIIKFENLRDYIIEINNDVENTTQEKKEEVEDLL